jgi:polysaccharide export outer membrane protein
MTRKLPASGRAIATALALACSIAGLAGCGAMNNHREKKIPQIGVIDGSQPRELQMVSMPTYVVEPPDELEISVRPASLEISTTTLIVRQDGVIDLGFNGDVYVAGLTLEEVERKIAQHLAPIADQKRIRDPIHVSVRLVNGNQSKQYYVLGTVTTQGKFPMTGSETVLDAIANVNGLHTVASKRNIWVARRTPHCGQPWQILPVDWIGITQHGITATNYQIMPGDRIYVKAQRIIAFDTALSRIISPIERIFGVTLLGASTVNQIKGNVGNNNNGF